MKITAKNSFPSIWCVRADFGRFAQQFVDGGYAGIGWLADNDLSGIESRDQLYPLYHAAHPADTSKLVIGQQVGQISRFLLEIKAEDYIITPSADNGKLHYGQVKDSPAYYYESALDDECPYRHRRHVDWASSLLSRNQFSVPFQNTMRSSLTVFSVSQQIEFLSAIGVLRPDAYQQTSETDHYRVVLNQLLELDPQEFEILATHLLSAIGFEAEHIGKPGDGGVDATGELDIAGMAKIKLYVQVKRFQLAQKISANTVKALRQSIPYGGQGAFVTTAGFQKKAYAVAADPQFAYIGLVNGQQLVDLLQEHWENIPSEFRDKLGLKQGLVLA